MASDASLIDEGLDFDRDMERSRTLGCRTGHHLNSAGSALPSTAVVDTVVDHLRREEREGGYEAAAAVRGQVDAVYDSVADLIGASPSEIALTDSASTGLRVIVDALRIGAANTLVVSRSTYVSHALHLLTVAREHGARLEIVRNAENGQMDISHLDSILERVDEAIVSVAHIPTSSGLVEPVTQVGSVARRYNALFILDATQSVGQIPVDVRAIDCHVLVTTGRKFLRGPRGTAFLYVRRGLLERTLPTAPDVRATMWSGQQDWVVEDSARRFEVWETSVAGRLGLGVAIDELRERGIGPTSAYLKRLASYCRDRLREISGVQIYDPPAANSAIVTFGIDGVDPRGVVGLLAERNVFVVAVPASHAQWDLGMRGIGAVVRASVHVFNDAADAHALVEGVEHIAASESVKSL